jgi:hypothetical protein
MFDCLAAPASIRAQTSNATANGSYTQVYSVAAFVSLYSRRTCAPAAGAFAKPMADNGTLFDESTEGATGVHRTPSYGRPMAKGPALSCRRAGRPRAPRAPP